MIQISVNRRHLAIAVAAIAVLVSIAWISAGARVSAASSTPVVYITTGENFPDALGAGPVAANVKGPILLVANDSIPGETAAELTRLAPDKIIIVGGTAVVSTSVENGLHGFAGTVERIAGENRYDTAAQLSAATYPVTVDADTLGGKDSTRYVRHGMIEMTQSGNGWMVRPILATGETELPEMWDRTAHSSAMSGKGYAVFGLTGPASIDGHQYRLASFDLCFFGSTITSVRAVAIKFFDVPHPDDEDMYMDVVVQGGETDRTSGCYTYNVNTNVGQGIGLQAQIDGTIEFFSVKSRWLEVPANS